jgi:hypothetical protein
VKTSDEVVGSKPQLRHAEQGRIRYESVPCWPMAKDLFRETSRSRVIGRGWRDRVLNAKP